MTTQSEKCPLWKEVLSCILILILLFSFPINVFAQDIKVKHSILNANSLVRVRVDDTLKFNKSTDKGLINGVIDNDVYSTDGTDIIIAKGTHATIEYSFEENGRWGSAGEINLKKANTRTIDNQPVSLILSETKEGTSRKGIVVPLVIFFFPIGFIASAIKGTNPTIYSGTSYDTRTANDIIVEIPSLVNDN